MSELNEFKDAFDCHKGEYFCDLALMEVDENENPIMGYIIDFEKKEFIEFDFVEFDESRVQYYYKVLPISKFSSNKKIYVKSYKEAIEFVKKYDHAPEGERLELTNTAFLEFYNFIESWSNRNILKEETNLKN